MVKIVKLVFFKNTTRRVSFAIPFKMTADPEVCEEMRGSDTGMAGEGSIVAGIGVDADIVPPSTVKVGKAQAESLPV